MDNASKINFSNIKGDAPPPPKKQESKVVLVALGALATLGLGLGVSAGSVVLIGFSIVLLCTAPAIPSSTPLGVAGISAGVLGLIAGITMVVAGTILLVSCMKKKPPSDEAEKVRKKADKEPTPSPTKRIVSEHIEAENLPYPATPVIEQYLNATHFDKLTPQEQVQVVDAAVQDVRDSINQSQVRKLEKTLSSHSNLSAETRKTLVKTVDKLVKPDNDGAAPLITDQMIDQFEKEVLKKLEQLEDDLKNHRVPTTCSILDQYLTPEQQKVLIKGRAIDNHGGVPDFVSLSSTQDRAGNTAEEVGRMLINKQKLLAEFKNADRNPELNALEKECLLWMGYKDVEDFEVQKEAKKARKEKLQKDLIDKSILKETTSKLNLRLDEQKKAALYEKAGVTQASIPQLAMIIGSFNGINSVIIEKVIKNQQKKLDEKLKLIVNPEIHGYLSKELKKTVTNLSKVYVESLVKSEKEHITKWMKMPQEELKQALEKYVESILQQESVINAIATQALSNDEDLVDYFVKYGKFIKVWAPQGAGDTDEILGRGVCLAKCIRNGAQEQQTPDAPLKEDSYRVITADDRITQALYQTAKLTSHSKNFFPQEILQKYGFTKEKKLVESEKGNCLKVTSDLYKTLKSFVNDKDKLQGANGVFYIQLIFDDQTGHAIQLRFDRERNIVRFHDPNLGLFEIPGDKFGDKAKEMAQLLKSTLYVFYRNLAKARVVAVQ